MDSAKHKSAVHLFFISAVAMLFSVSAGYAQDAAFDKYFIMETGASVYLPDVPEWETTFSPDSSTVYTAEVFYDSANYGVIMIDLSEPLGSNTQDWDTLLLHYMQFLNSDAFELTNTIAPGFGQILESHLEAHGILEYGEDGEGYQYAIMGWIDENSIAVLYTYYLGDMNIGMQNLFLNSFRFPVE